ncbi:RNA polymerase sigma factor [Aquimarina sp. RZ0]|uniref:RNA polymerase sigma factor n=1 Tax=Aquimarina sp. RZ0 TaxID=2607730 RepID=UPI0011F15EA2|nr:hypothetical protein [Aquimarina sp. RZ0]KAA1247536.1 hypothetical protein F0000_03515 [Aquimarina sp. RZ0]
MADERMEQIISKAIQGNELPFNTFLKETFTALLPKLLVLTKSRDEAKEVFIISMQKFWECFVIKQQKLPHNSIGYIYIMCKNAWLLQKREQERIAVLNNEIIHTQVDNQINESPENSAFDREMEAEEHTLKHKALTMALETLSPKCKTIMETDLDPKNQLKSLQEPLGYTNYQALVQAKYNCKKRLVKKVYELLNQLKETTLLNR